MDKRSLQRVLNNLIDNAIQHSYKNSIIEINVKYLKDETCCFEIVDHGCGIPENEIAMIFEPSFRASNNKENNMNIGLGLTIVKALLDQHAIDINVESQINKGTKFYFQVPCMQNKI